MTNSEKILLHGQHFLELLLDFEGDDARLKEAGRGIGGWQIVLILQSLLAVIIPEYFGAEVSFEDFARYAKPIAHESEDDPRQIVLEAVLRTGAGDDRFLEGLSIEELLAAYGLVAQHVMRDLEARSISRGPLIERAVKLASIQPILNSPDLLQ